MNIHQTLKLIAIFLLLASARPALTATYYWDANGASAGAGTNPNGTWGVSPYWSSSSAGTALTSAIATTAADPVIFSAGTDAIGPYTVTLSGLQSAQSVTAQEGNVTLSDGTLALTNCIGSGSPFLVSSGSATLTLDPTSTLFVTNTVAGNNFANFSPATNTIIIISGLVKASVNNPANKVLLRWPSGFGSVLITTNLGTDPVLATALNGGSFAFPAPGGIFTMSGPQDLGSFAFDTRSAGNVGTVNLGATTNTGVAMKVGSLFIGASSGNLSGATLNVNASVSNDSITLYAGGVINIAGALTQAGTAANTVGNATASYKSGTLNLLPGASASMAGLSVVGDSTVNSAGNLNCALLTLGSGTTAGTLVLGNGTAAGAATMTGITTSGTGSNVVVGANPAVSTLTVNNSANYVFAGRLGGDGPNQNSLALIKTNSGSLTLSSLNTYSGGTTVSQGTLLVNGSVAGLGGVLVAGGTLGGAGSLGGPVIVQTYGTLWPGLGGSDTSTLTLSNSLELSGITVFVLNRDNAQTAAKVAGLAAVNYGGTLRLINAGAPLQAGDQFTLFEAAAYSGAFDTLDLPSPGTGRVWNTSGLATSGTVRVEDEPVKTGFLADDFKLNGGAGWSGGWVSGSGFTHFSSGTSGLNYAAGGYAVYQEGGSGIFYANYGDYRGGVRAAAAPLTNIVWFSALMLNSNATCQAYLGFNTSNTNGTPFNTYFPSSRYNIGISNDTLLAGFGNNGARLGTVYQPDTAPLSPGETHLVLGRLTLIGDGGADQLEVWADPPDLANLGAPLWQQAGVDIGSDLFNVTLGAVAGGAVDALRLSDGGGNSSQAFTDVTGATNLSQAPIILVTPQFQTMTEGGNATFAVVASGAGLTYRWFKNGSTGPIACAASITGATLDLTNVTTSCSGNYSVWVSNAYGAVLTVPAALRVVSQRVALTAINYATNMPVHAHAIPVDAIALWDQMGVAVGTPVWVRTQDGTTNIPISLGTNGRTQVVWVYTRLAPAARLELIAEPTNQWPATTNVFVASTDPPGTSAMLRNGVIQLTFPPAGWNLGFSPAGMTNYWPMIQNGSVDFWLDYTNRGRVTTGSPLAMGLLPWTNSTTPTYTVSFGSDGRPILTRSRQMTGFASAVTFIEDFELVPGMPLLVCRVRWQNSGSAPVWLAYVGNGGGIRGKWVANLMAQPLIEREDDPFTGTVGGGAIRSGWLSGLARLTMESLSSGCGVGLSTILPNTTGHGSMIWVCSNTEFGCNFIDPVVGQFPFLVDAGTTYSNGNAILLTQTETGCWRQTTNVWSTLKLGQLPVLQSPCAVFMDGRPLLPQTASALRGTNVLDLLESSAGGVLQAALRMEFTNRYICRVSAQMPAPGDSILVQVRRLETGALSTLLQTDQAGDYEIDMNQVLGWNTDTQFVLETTLTGSAALTALSIQELPPAAPVLESPLPGQSVTDFAVSYRWASSQPMVIEYDLQFSRLPDFSTNQQIRISTGDLSPTWQPADNGLPAAGVCYWRVRALKSGAPGIWSATNSFAVNTARALLPLKRPVTAQDPLFTIECTLETQYTNFNPAVPADIRAHCALMLEGMTGVITNAARGVDQLSYPIVIRRGLDLPDLEWVFQNCANVIGVQGGEGLALLYASDPYTRRLIMLCAKYGMWFHEADGIYTSDKWYLLMRQQGAFMTNYGPYVMLSQKNNICDAQHYSQSASLGLWLSGVTHMHGAWNDNEFYWNAVGFGPLNTCYGERSGLYGYMPDNFWNLCFVMGLGRGCALFNIEGQPYRIWDTPAWQRYMVPLVRGILNHGLVPEKRQVLEQVKVAVWADVDNRATNTMAYTYYGAYGPLFHATYGFENMSGISGELWEFYPNTGRYGYIPVLPQGNVTWPGGVNISNVALTQLQTTQAVAQVFNTAYPSNWYSGDALVSLVGDTLTVMNSWENMDILQTYDAPLSHGPFQRINGTIEVYAYLVGKREGTAGDETLWLQMDAELTNRAAVVSVTCAREPVWQVDPPSAVNSVTWAGGSLNLNLSQAQGAVQVTLRATHGLTVSNGSGSGSYTNGSLVNIAAGPPPAGYRFDRWTVLAGAPVITEVRSAATTLVMPPGDAAITALYVPASRPTISAVSMTNGQAHLVIIGEASGTYQVQVSTNLTNWVTVFLTNSPVLPVIWTDTGATNFNHRFYRVLFGP